jgi:hypothetical protein
MIRVLLISIFAGLLFVGCSPYIELSGSNNAVQSNIIEQSNNYNFSKNIVANFEGKIILSDKNYNISGTIKFNSFENFQLIIISKTLGIQVAKIHFYDDSLLYIDKINHYYYNGLLSEFKYLAGLKISSEDISHLLLGRSLSNISLMMSVFPKYKFYKNNFKGNFELYNFGFLRKHELTYKNTYLIFKYNRYYKKNKLPSQITVNYEFGNNKYKFYLNLYSIIFTNSKFKTFIVPKNYKQIL